MEATKTNESLGFQMPAMEMVGSSGGSRLLAIVLGIIFAISIPALIFAPWVQNVTGFGKVVGTTPFERQQTIDSPVEGRIVKWHVIEGSKVKTGDLIAEVADNDPMILERLREERNMISMRVDQAKSRVSAQEVSVQQIELSRRNAIESAKSRVKVAEDNVKQAENSLRSAEFGVTANTQNLERVKAGLASGLYSTRQLELQVQDMGRAQAEVDRAKAALQAAVNEKLARDADLQKIETDFQNSIATGQATLASGRSDVANSVAEMQRIEVRVARQSSQTVRAPRNGTILRLLTQPGGQQLKGGDAIAILVPETQDLVVELWMSGNDIPLIHNGDRVRLQFEGWPAIQFAGWPSVAVGTYGGRVMLVDSTDDGQGKFRILVKPDENDQPWPSDRYLRQGVRTNGWVLLNRVSLGYELWRQFNGFPPTVTPQLETDSKKGGKKK
ncbi:MAG TPA: HlyD family efflux transporter periplasmic adaptor subunit [Bryobacteraceae bacterium]|nr:HlyD family efflux transporter periplasmic adaptor subunit [Bryobacteraceae bacterium]